MANNLQGNICSRSLGCRLVAATYFATVHQQWCNVRRINKTDQSNGYISLAACWHAHGSALVMAVLGVQVFFGGFNDIENWCIFQQFCSSHPEEKGIMLCWVADMALDGQASELPCDQGHVSPFILRGRWRKSQSRNRKQPRLTKTLETGCLRET